jgi:hypothetical protein
LGQLTFAGLGRGPYESEGVAHHEGGSEGEDQPHNRVFSEDHRAATLPPGFDHETKFFLTERRN